MGRQDCLIEGFGYAFKICDQISGQKLLPNMQVTVEIPDEMAQRLTRHGQDPARTTLEALAIEGYRSGALTSYQTRRLLGFQTL